jgi:signal transduction histidine kinase
VEPSRSPFRSLTLRLALQSAVWVALGLTLAGWLVFGVVSEQLLRTFDARLNGLLDAVVGAAALGPDGKPRLDRAVSEMSFSQPFSGYYWQITVPGGDSATSRSLWDARLPSFDMGSMPGPHVMDMIGPRGERLRLAERAVVLADTQTPLLVQVAVSRARHDAEVRRLRLLVTGIFALLGAGLVAGVAVQAVWGLSPLRRARRALAEVRAGERERLATDPAPSEIAPLMLEIDALVAQNRATVERARAHVGNLAHALKTPIAVQRTALDATAPDLATLRGQNMAMERLVQHHLARARAAALSGAAITEAVPLAVAEEIARALRRLFTEKGLEIRVLGDARARVRVDHQDLAEMLGNLMENACKWARGRVALRVERSAGEVMVTVTDDGPGLPEEERSGVMARGARLDEAAPGSGLGLAIVRDLVELYGGSLSLEEAEGGGLLARLRLPGL